MEDSDGAPAVAPITAKDGFDLSSTPAAAATADAETDLRSVLIPLMVDDNRTEEGEHESPSIAETVCKDNLTLADSGKLFEAAFNSATAASRLLAAREADPIA